MTEQNPLVSAESAALESEWERQGRKITQVCDANYERFKERLKFVNRAALDQVSKALEILPCPGCYQSVKGTEQEGMITCTCLVVTIEPHPMQDTGSIVNAVCHHCGYQQMWPYKVNMTSGAELRQRMLKKDAFGHPPMPPTSNMQEMIRQQMKSKFDLMGGTFTDPKKKKKK